LPPQTRPSVSATFCNRCHNRAMYNLTRRSFLSTTTAAAIASAAGVPSSLGVQLYTVRSVLPEKPLETLKAIEQIGYKEVEATLAGLDKIWPSLQQTRLKPVSLHLDGAMFLTKTDELAPALDDAKRRGFRYVVMPYIAPNDRDGLDLMHKLAETLNQAGEKCRAAGLRLCYHNHAFEFEPVGSTTRMDVLLAETDKRLVGIEVDVFWVSVAGQDPVEFLKKHAGRVPLVHLKDKAQGTETRFNEGVPRTAFKEVGSGVLDFAAILRAASTAGVEHYIVEQDQTPGDPVESLRKSYDYLSKLRI
jgi:sugar phosphate isomerase/epimerase